MHEVQALLEQEKMKRAQGEAAGRAAQAAILLRREFRPRSAMWQQAPSSRCASALLWEGHCQLGDTRLAQQLGRARGVRPRERATTREDLAVMELASLHRALRRARLALARNRCDERSGGRHERAGLRLPDRPRLDVSHDSLAHLLPLHVLTSSHNTRCLGSVTSFLDSTRQNEQSESARSLLALEAMKSAWNLPLVPQLRHR